MRQVITVVLFGLLFITNAFSQTPLSVDADTIALWNFDADTAGTVTDLSSNNIQGTAYRADLEGMPGLPTYGNARYFKDQMSYISFGTLTPGSPLDLAVLPEWSVEFMIRRQDTWTEIRNIFDNGIVSIQTNEGKIAAYINKNGVRYGVETEAYLGPFLNYVGAVIYKNNELGIMVSGKIRASMTVPNAKKISKKNYGSLIRVGGMPSEGITNYELGNFHSCLTTDSGKMKCWGTNTYGGLGNGDTISYSLPINVEKFDNPSDFSLSFGSTCAVKTGKVYCWGNNANLEIGQPALAYSSLPLEVPGITNAIDIEMGSSHACAILSDHTVKCWGANTTGQLGIGIFSTSSLPTAVPSLSNVQKLSLGAAHTCALLTGGSVYCWGSNSSGQLGVTGSNSAIPVAVSLSPATNIAVGSVHSCAQLASNSVKCWGDNTYGQLGNNSTTASTTPVSVSNLSSSTITKLESRRGNHTCLVDTGVIKCWGRNDKEQIGQYSGTYPFLTVPTVLTEVSNVSTLKLGYSTNCFQQSNHMISCFGNNQGGMLGDATTVPFTGIPTTVLAVKQGHAHGWIDDIRISDVARYSISRPILAMTAPIGTVSSATPTISISVSSSRPIDVVTLAAWLNGSPVTGLTYNSGVISGTLSQNMLIGENTLEVQIGDTLWNIGNMAKKIIYSPSLNPQKAIMVRTGGQNSCYVTGEGYVWCWGSNEFGQLGTEGGRYSSSPVKNPYLKNIVDISISLKTLCATDRASIVRCWGSNSAGQMGIGSWELTKSSIPREISFSKSVSKIEAGSQGFCALHPDHTLSCWGVNYNRILNPTTDDYPIVPTLNGLTNVKDISLGHENACIIKTDDTLWCWGANWSGQVGNGSSSNIQLAPVQVLTNVKTVSVGFNSVCAITNAGLDYCWGANGGGVVDNTANWDYNTPQIITAAAGLNSLSVSDNFACDLSTSGVASCWGQNAHGEIGNGGFGSRVTTAYVISSTNFSQLSVWANTVCGLALNQDVYCWGANNIGQAGQSSVFSVLSPSLVAPHTVYYANLSTLAAGEANTCMKKGIYGYCWGNNETSQIGTDTRNFLELYPVKMPITDYVQSSVGYGFICHLDGSWQVLCVGSNLTGQSGQAPSYNVAVPTVVPGLTDVSQIEAGLDFTCARKSNGTVYCWGANTFGQLGSVGAGTHIPRAVTGLTNIIDIKVAKRGYHACATRSNGAVFCWGSNSNGQLGQNPSYSLTPVELHQFANSKGISLGGETTCSINEFDKVTCIGSNIYGQLGTGNLYSNTNLIPVDIKNPIIKIHAGRFHTCALDSEETVYCWGRNNYGQLGNGLTEDSTVPVTPIKKIVELVSGNDHVCGITDENKLACWGFGINGQFGNGSNDNSSIPVFSDVTKK